jgi:hypothetical protein
MTCTKQSNGLQITWDVSIPTMPLLIVCKFLGKTSQMAWDCRFGEQHIYCTLSTVLTLHTSMMVLLQIKIIAFAAEKRPLNEPKLHQPFKTCHAADWFNAT